MYLRVKPKNQLPAELLSSLQIPTFRDKRNNIDLMTKLAMIALGKNPIITNVNGVSRRV
jgi:hypothetical protein